MSGTILKDMIHSDKIYNALMERFGLPIADQQITTVGVKDEGPGGKKTYKDEPIKDQEWSCPHVIKEGCCAQCGMMPEEMEETEQLVDEYMSMELSEDDLAQKAPPGREKQVKALKKEPGVDNPYAVAWASYNKK